ncbi:hypothetical protein [Paenibacillus tianjinensis]|uniref:Uncharacterized protein n=1 Tax=Paenibacillus tianjinensis TaxID=2810347 RepID=A0ABX7L5U0_9BACL|nr:hypothetical protein [Paenibacillus tianjinensis]QSF43284.1 hypothetical protein JRJ22_18630 [Paenibacillus tianjinensis]
MNINPRLLKRPIDIQPEQLALELTKGKTFCPGYITTRRNDGELHLSQSCWTSQQVVCLDFDNSKEDKESKEKVKDIKITWEQAQKEFHDSAMFMYKTFSYTDDWPRFRVVLAYDEPITNQLLFNMHNQKLFNKYPYVDSSTFQTQRLFFGGSDLYVFDYSNRIQTLPDGGFYDLYNYGYNIEDNIGAKTPLNTIEANKTKKQSNIELIINKDNKIIHRIKDKYPPVIFNTRTEACKYLKKVNLHEYLGIHSNYLNDIFTMENKPSASIFQDPSTGYWWYKCHSTNHAWLGSIIDITQRLTGLSNTKSFKYLTEVFNIKIQKTEWQQEQEEMFQLNMEFLNDEFYIEEAYPYLNSILRSPLYYSLLRELHLIGLENIHNLIQLKDDGSSVFFASIDFIMHRLERYCDFAKFKMQKEKRVRTVLALLSYLKLLNRVGTDSLPEAYTKRAIQESQKNGKKRLITFYSLHSFDANYMLDIEELAKQFKQLGMTVTNFDRQMVIKTLGKEEADRVFPERKEEQLSDINERTCLLLEESLTALLNDRGWTTEERIINNTYLDIDVEAEIRKRDRKIKDGDVITEDRMQKWLYEYKKKQLKKIIGGMIIKYELAISPLSNELMESKQIPLHYTPSGVPSYPKVIYRK